MSVFSSERSNESFSARNFWCPFDGFRLFLWRGPITRKSPTLSEIFASSFTYALSKCLFLWLWICALPLFHALVSTLHDFCRKFQPSIVCSFPLVVDFWMYSRCVKTGKNSKLDAILVVPSIWKRWTTCASMVKLPCQSKVQRMNVSQSYWTTLVVVVVKPSGKSFQLWQVWMESFLPILLQYPYPSWADVTRLTFLPISMYLSGIPFPTNS